MRTNRMLKKTSKTTIYAFLLASTLSLSACSMVEPATDAVLWLPKKVFITWPGAALRKVGIKPFEDKNNWQDEIEFGPRRKPGANPNAMQPQMGIPQGYMQAPPQGAYPYPPQQFNQQQFGTPGGFQPQPQTSNPYGTAPNMMGSGGYPPTGGYPPAPVSPPQGGGFGGYNPQQGNNMFGQQGTYAPPQQQGGYAPPPPPPLTQGGYGGYQQQPNSGFGQPQGGYGGYPSPQSGFQPYQPQGNSGGGYGQPPAMPYMQGEDPDAAYGMPPYMQDNQDSSPFMMGQHKLIRKFEPMAMEVYKEEDIQEENRKFEPLDLEVYMKKPDYNEKAKKSRNSSMFPLDEYKPKSDVEILEFARPNSLAKPDNAEKIDAEIKALIKRLDKSEETQYTIQQLPPSYAPPIEETLKETATTNNTKTEFTPINDNKTINLPSQLPKRVSKTPAKKEQEPLNIIEQKETARETEATQNISDSNWELNKQPEAKTTTGTIDIEPKAILSKTSSPRYMIAPPPYIEIKPFEEKQKNPLLNSNETVYKGVLPKSRYSK